MTRIREEEEECKINTLFDYPKLPGGKSAVVGCPKPVRDRLLSFLYQRS